MAPLTTLFLSIQDVPGMNPADLLGCFYLSIQIENVFAYGRGARERSEFYWLKASYFTLKFHPRHLITLVTTHDSSPFVKIKIARDLTRQGRVWL